MPYWKRAGAWAKEHTQTYSLKKAAPSVIVALLQYLFSGRNTFNQMAVSITLVIAGYLVLLSGEYLWKLLLMAPVALDSENSEQLMKSSADVAELKTRLEEPKISALEQSRRNLVDEKLRGATAQDIDLLRLVLQHGRADDIALIRSAPPAEQRLYEQALHKGFSWGLLTLGPSHGSSRAPVTINPDFIEALSFYILTRPTQASSSESSHT